MEQVGGYLITLMLGTQTQHNENNLVVIAIFGN